MKKYVLTGGPSVGKTTVIEILASRGYFILPEAARMIIEEEMALSGGIMTHMEDRFVFQSKIAERQLELESTIEPNHEQVFLDRGIIDGVAYSLEYSHDIPNAIVQHGKGRYDTVFILESLGVYVKDGIRGRTLEDAERTHERIRQAYIDFGYTPTSVPVLGPQERVDFILEMVQAATSLNN